jgi:hypothetical protein
MPPAVALLEDLERLRRSLACLGPHQPADLGGKMGRGHRGKGEKMLHLIRRLRLIVLGGAVVLTAGRLLDLRWHATHKEFETGIDQLQAHWLAWLGALLLLAASAVAVRSATYRSPGFVVVLASASLYVSVAVWHFWLHQQLRDPDLPHVLLALSQIGLYAGSLMVGAGLVIPRCREKYVLSRTHPAGA